MTTLPDLYADLRRACEAAGGQQAWARAHGISPAYVCDVLNARRLPGTKILRALGWIRLVTYQRSNHE